VKVDKKAKRIIVEDGLHSPLGPSSAKRWLNCPGSVRATAGMPSSSSEYADEGTAAHGLSEHCRLHNVRAKRFLGWRIDVLRGEDKRTFEVTQEMIDSVQEFIDRCEEVPASMVLVEQLLPFEEYVPGGFGTLDDARLRPGIGVITDFKHGKGVQVYAEENEQLMCQALSVYLKWDWLFEFKEFVLRISQPRLDHFDDWTISVERLLDWSLNVLSRGAVATTYPNALFAAGSWCQFCKIKGACETRTLWATSQVLQVPQSEFEDLDAAIAAVQAAPLKDVGTGNDMMSNAQLAKALGVVDLIAGWCKDVKAVAMRFLQQGFPVGDWKLVEGRSKRQWNLPEEKIAEVLQEEGGLSEDQVYEKKILTPPKAEKLIGKKHPLITSPVYVNKPRGKPKLAPGTDKRPALSVDVLLEFADLGEEEEKDDD